MPLSWRPGYSLSRKPGRRTRTRAPAPGEFSFIPEPTLQNREIETVPTTSSKKADSSQCSSAGASSDDRHPDQSLWLIQTQHVLVDEFGFHVQASSICISKSPSPYMPVSIESGQTPRIYPFTLTDRDDFRFTDMSISPMVLNNDLAQKYGPVLFQYDQHFCKIPLTSTMQVNPFKCHPISSSAPTFLLHAVMALAGHHVQSSSTQHHRLAALHFLRQSLVDTGSVASNCSLIDAVIILFSLDEAESALGSWASHLTGARSLIEAHGGIETWLKGDRAHVQAAILVWWDAIISLMAREEPVFPESYFHAIVSTYSESNWDYFSLCGCPFELVRVVMQLLRVVTARQRCISECELASHALAVSEIELFLESWSHEPPSTYADEEDMHKDQDKMHCSEAWRHGLLLYIFRVFQWTPGTTVPLRVLSRARAVIDHVFACRENQMISRQALFPLLLAGCELRDQSWRTRIITACKTWNDRTRYHVFGSAAALLDAVWAAQQAEGVENVWWGQEVDRIHLSESSAGLKTRLCFG